MPPTCEFQLERENAIYFTGEELKGCIILRTQRVINVNAVFVDLQGEAIVRWDKGDDDTSTCYMGQQRYLHERIQLFSGQYFPAGRHVYNIKLRLPPECPSTCQERYGQVTYTITVVLDLQSGYIFRKPIFVHQTLNLNDIPDCMIPIKDENVRYFCKWPCKSGPIFTCLEVPFGGYVPGEDISFSISIDNQSYYDIPSIEASLNQHFIFLASNPTNRKCIMKTLAKTEINRSILRLIKRMYKITLTVPSNTPRSSLNSEYIISLRYELKVVLKTGLLHYDIVMSVPIVIGTIPLERQDGNDNELIVQETINDIGSENLNGNMEGIINMTNNSESAELPSYESCVTLPPLTNAASRSLQNFNNLQPINSERQQLNVNLSQFPGYNTFSCRIQNEN